MDPAVAALIGAGTGAIVAIASQFIGHALSVKRDRANQRRQRRTDAVVEAATLLYWTPDWTAEPGAEAQMTTPSLQRGVPLLQLHLGWDHPLVTEYVKVAEFINKALWQWRAEAGDSDLLEDARLLTESREKRDGWMRIALAEIERA